MSRNSASNKSLQLGKNTKKKRVIFSTSIAVFSVVLFLVVLVLLPTTAVARYFGRPGVKIQKLFAPGKINRETPIGTPLEVVSWQGQCEAMKVLLCCGADVNHRNRDGFTPLHAAAIGKTPHAISILLEAGARIEPSNSGLTPLHDAAELGRLENCQVLVQAGIDIFAQGRIVGENVTKTAWEIALENGHHEVADYLQKEMRRQLKEKQGD